jgi:hypothetical protein
MDASPPKLRSLRATSVNVPLARPHPTASGVVGSAPLVLVDLETDKGLVGHAYVFRRSCPKLPAVSSATKFRNPSRIFMPQRELRWRAAAPVLEDMKIRMAGASSADLNQDLSWTGYGGRYIDHLRRTASANKSYRFHRILMRVSSETAMTLQR